MDLNKWCNLKSEPRLKHLTEAGFGLVKAHIESFDQAVTDGLCRVVVSKGGISNDLRVFPAECRGRRCTYTEEIWFLKQNQITTISIFKEQINFVFSQADVSWSVKGVI
uniref:Uncharacterized protein n=1 Tax=Sinocyclocheilus rhinocerous TaxID=307959 RepID=A0A673G4W8_9TELE